MNKWIVTDYIDPMAKEGLEALGRKVDWRPDITNAQLLDIIEGYEGMMISSKTIVNKELIDRASQLKIVARAGSGMEHVDREYCESKGITCLSSPEGNCNAVAEHAFGMMLSLSNHIASANRELLMNTWKREENRGFEWRGKKAGIIGYGHTGRAFARKFRGWEVEVRAYDKYISGFGDELVVESSYEDILEQCDVISFHIPYNTETHHWIDRSFINSCKAGVLLINTSRGAIADTAALLWGIKSGKLGGICLDVFEDEPISVNKVHPAAVYDRLFASRKVIATPHIAGWSSESKVLLVKILLEKIEYTLKNPRYTS